ncbi:MAG: MarR family winged helix-turn-helix transcriptional regulator [Candidatus Spyradosoma sp.]
MTENNCEMCRGLLFRVVNRVRNVAAARDKFRVRAHTLPQVKVMQVLFERSEEGAKLKDVARELGLTPGAVSQTVDALVRTGFVSRTADAADRRAVRLVPTKKSLAFRDRMDGITREVLGPVVAEIPEKDLKTFFRVLTLMNERLEER